MPRGRPSSISPTRPINTHLDAELMARLDLHLFSEVEGRVPYGAYKIFFDAQLRKFFGNRTLDLAPYLGTLPGERTVEAPESTIALLRQCLERS